MMPFKFCPIKHKAIDIPSWIIAGDKYEKWMRYSKMEITDPIFKDMSGKKKDNEDEYEEDWGIEPSDMGAQ